MMYAVDEGDGHIVADPTWSCVADVVGSYHGGFAVDGRVTGTLLCRVDEADEWEPVETGCSECGASPQEFHKAECEIRWRKFEREPEPEQSTIAAEAHAAVYGDRGKDYGHPRDNFADTAAIWTALLGHKLQPGQAIDASDVARCMIGIKLARDLNSPKRDNRVDIIGYAITLDRLETGN